MLAPGDPPKLDIIYMYTNIALSYKQYIYKLELMKNIKVNIKDKSNS